MKRICLVVLFLCSVFAYTQDTLFRDTAITAYTAKGIKLSWEKDASTKYAFDDGSNKPKELQKEYTTIKDAEGKEVIIPYKAVVNGKEDVLNAVIDITDTSLNTAEVIFKTLNTGKAIPIIQQYKTPNGRKYTLQLKGTYDYATEEVMAMLVPKDSGAKQQVIGSFKLVHLSPKRVNITLVPLDAQAQQKIQSYKEELQKIYDSIGVTFNIKEEPIMDISSIVQGNEIVSEDAEAMSTYSTQQQQINAMYKGQSNDRYVVFITSKRASTGQGGYMRLNGQYGYVYGNAEAKTLAHEIGHGVFRLEHPWKKYNTTKNSSNLLLDYKAQGKELSHLDWQQINDPAFKLYAFQSQSEGSYLANNMIGVLEIIDEDTTTKKKTIVGKIYNITKEEYEDFKNEKGVVYGCMDWFNRNINPVGIIGYGTYQTISGRDLITNEELSRIDGFNNMVFRLGIMYMGGKLIEVPISYVYKQVLKEKIVETTANGLLKLESSVSKVMGNTYKAMGEVTAPIKNKELLNSLNATSKGNWVKVYEAGIQNGAKIETHYFRNNTTGQVFDIKIKYNDWNQKVFKTIGQ